MFLIFLVANCNYDFLFSSIRFLLFELNQRNSKPNNNAFRFLDGCFYGHCVTKHNKGKENKLAESLLLNWFSKGIFRETHKA